VRIELVEGDLTRCKVDALVNAANNNLWMGAGVAGAIKHQGGDDIESEAIKLGPVHVGEVVVTGAGTLAARHIIHAAVMGQDLIPTADSIRACTEHALRAAEQLKLRSIAFPALGTGVGGFSLELCAAIMGAVFRAHRAASLERIVVVLFGDTAFAAFSKHLEQAP
jgi:O-acetyl-ADP-ribose deacetylase (regulator of RNase III)